MKIQTLKQLIIKNLIINNNLGTSHNLLMNDNMEFPQIDSNIKNSSSENNNKEFSNLIDDAAFSSLNQPIKKTFNCEIFSDDNLLITLKAEKVRIYHL